MTNTVTITKILEGPRHAMFHVYLKSDGSSGELTDQVIVDPAVDFVPALPAGTKCTITQIWYSMIGFDTLVEFDATTDTPAWKIPQASDANYIDFRFFGGVKDRSGTGATGKIQITTAGFSAATDEGTFILEVKKD